MDQTLYSRARKLIVVNNILYYLGILICLYLILLPYFPEIIYFFNGGNHHQKEVHATIPTPPQSILNALKANTDYVAVPSVGIEQSIVEATTIKSVHEKVWRRPQGSTPDKGSNTVLVAHRYVTIGGNRASTFYHLPKVIAGDIIYVVWKGTLYTYSVTSTETVLPNEVRVEQPTIGPELTLYTCTPLWTSDHRFVIHAKLLN